MRFIIALTGASGVQYGLRLISVLERLGHEIDLVVSNGAREVMKVEAEIDTDRILSKAQYRYDIGNIGAHIASGTHPSDGMIIVPCSMNTLAAIANGISSNLILRAADCTLKEERRLILVLRETPLNQIHLENMLSMKRAGASILPASPGFYNKPKSIDDLLDFIVGKILNLLGIRQDVLQTWSPKD